jgi:hypothetical protein
MTSCPCPWPWHRTSRTSPASTGALAQPSPAQPSKPKELVKQSNRHHTEKNSYDESRMSSRRGRWVERRGREGRLEAKGRLPMRPQGGASGRSGNRRREGRLEAKGRLPMRPQGGASGRSGNRRGGQRGLHRGGAAQLKVAARRGEPPAGARPGPSCRRYTTALRFRGQFVVRGYFLFLFL